MLLEMNDLNHVVPQNDPEGTQFLKKSCLGGHDPRPS